MAEAPVERMVFTICGLLKLLECIRATAGLSRSRMTCARDARGCAACAGGDAVGAGDAGRCAATAGSLEVLEAARPALEGV